VKAKWSEEATEERGERRYYCQNWRADVSALLTDAGSMVEWVKYSSYGVPFALPAGDTDSDGDWDATDSAAITGTYDVRKDANLDGVINAFDVTHANSITGGYQTLGRGILSSSGAANRKGYAGYEYDPTFEGAGRHLYHVRFRVYDADTGRWTARDPLGYVDGMSLYEYVRSAPLDGLDQDGLVSATCTGGGCHTAATSVRTNNLCGIPAECAGIIREIIRPLPSPNLPPLPRPGNPPIPPSCVGVISPADWTSAMRHWRIAMMACGVAPTITCAPCAISPGSTTPPCAETALGGPGSSCQVTICTNAPAGCGPVGATLIHELTHCRQNCDPGKHGGTAISTEERICREVEAYRAEGECRGVPAWQFNRCICGRACDSIPWIPRNSCLGTCLGLLRNGKCRGGHVY
jgi:RHS repeat-associated protein